MKNLPLLTEDEYICLKEYTDDWYGESINNEKFWTILMVKYNKYWDVHTTDLEALCKTLVLNYKSFKLVLDLKRKPSPKNLKI
jgi:hypothetical protein